MPRRTVSSSVDTPTPRTKRHLRRWLLALLGLVVLVIVVVVCLALSAMRVASHLYDAQQATQLLQQDLLDRHATKAQLRDDLRQVQEDAHAATRHTDSPLWQVPAAIPWLGDPAEEVAGVAGAVRDLADDVLPVLTHQRGLLMHSLQRDDGSIALEPLVAAQQPVARAHTSAEQVLGDLTDLPRSGIGPVDGAVVDLTGQVRQLTGTLGTADEALHLLPPMLGQDGPRRYFVAFQNDTEARGLGGLVGAYAILEADHGRLDFVQFGIDSDFNGVGPVSTEDFGDAYQRHYQGAGPGKLFSASNVSPHMPYAGQLWMRYWHAKTGQQLDGALTMDPTALSELLGVTGPATLADGTTVSAGNVVRLTQQAAYENFDDPVARKAFNIEVAKAVAERVLGKGPDRPVAFARALGTAVDQRRLLVWSAHDAEQQRLAGLPIGGTLSNTEHLFSGVVINNAAGSKLDYYLKREVRYEAPRCHADRRISTVTITLTNTAPRKGLPDYVAARVARPPAPGLPRGTERLLVGYYATKGAHLAGATLDGEQALLANNRERGRPVFTATVEVPPQRSRTLVLHVLEPAKATGPVTTLVQPLVIPQTTHVQVPQCSVEEQ